MLDTAYGLEEVLTAAERQFGWQLTLYDPTGLFADDEGRSLLGPRRSSHRRFPACALGFGDRCHRHCGSRIHVEAAGREAPIVSTCWKGLRQVVVPIRVAGLHRALLCCGIWRHGQTPAVYRELESAARTARNRLPTIDRRALERLSMIVATFAGGLPRQSERGDEDGGSRRAQIRHFITAHAHEPIMLADLAHALELSPSRCSHLVRERFGRSFQELLQLERIRRARALLTSTDHTVAHIAELVGYPDQYHFNRLFSRMVGISPGRYRRRPRL